MDIKERLLEACKKTVNHRLHTIQSTIASHQKALNSETKSSVGDKHETGRAMLQLEMEKAGNQLQSVQEMLQNLSKINASKSSKKAHLGSIVETNIGVYFLSTSVGKVILENKNYFAISTVSPIGKLLLGKEKGVIVEFNNNKIKVLSVY